MSLSFYTVETKYCEFLREADARVPINSDAKSGRPFVGVVLRINGYDYFAPLTSPKPKHRHMKNQVDFIKINEGKWGAINLNNMIPACSECLHKINMSPMPNDSTQEKNYKSLLSNQLSWCNSHREYILDRANKLLTARQETTLKRGAATFVWLRRGAGNIPKGKRKPILIWISPTMKLCY